jgi:hypothetical protein
MSETEGQGQGQAQLEHSNTLIWDANIDMLLAGWCDNAKCFEWMHSEAHSIYDKRSKQFMISINYKYYNCKRVTLRINLLLNEPPLKP